MNELITVKEVKEILKVGESKAYIEMRKINKEMEEKGFLTVKGRVNKLYLMRAYGLAGDSDGDK